LTRSDDLDLRVQKDVNEFFGAERPEYVFLGAAKVGGIGFNKQHQQILFVIISKFKQM
jgi:GDP-L-fucose synthase